ncbi:unnamed protein product [Ilex paraguariensis]|uniref:Uncharacterized protein n=1 Tax=Ilex paraguariensis TaxID=185542 RepID=A0ABC8QZE8_9AQUA
MELGCDARGHSRAGNDTMIWYCAVLAGRQSLELDKMRETMRRLQESLSRDGVLNVVDQDTASTPAAIALKEKRLTFTWLDGEAQKKYCFFYINSEDGYETCGPRRDITDVPKLFIVRYKKKATEDGMQIEKKPKNLFEALHSDDTDPASQLVAVYNGSAQISEIIQWISQIIQDGDSRDLPFFRATTPALVPEDGDPIWSQGTEKFISTSKGVKQKIGDLIRGIYDYLYDPRIGPILLLGALMSFGSIWLRRSPSTHPIESSHSGQPSTTDDVRPGRRKRHRTGSNQDPPRSITDVEPKDAHQMKLSDSDSE